ncbi:DUF6292 family protein [Lentzea sp. NPDC058450]|uniref:DUF6292 family protein n=1 Tax=Lentzea sp. NPDC058450 TaxID=3346505 RepID=UPI00365AE5F0
MSAALDYALRVTRELGLSGESSCVEDVKPLRVYVAVDGSLPDHSGDVALLWTEGLGWAIAVEDGAELVVVARLGGPAEPSPRTVARWVRDQQTAKGPAHEVDRPLRRRTG